MSKSAQLAQGATIFIAGTSSAAKNITAITPGFPTIITSTAHGLANGDSVTIAAITGTIGTDATNGLNGDTYTIKNVTANTFCVEANTVGLLYTSGGTATGTAWIEITEVKGIKPSGASASKIDVTDLKSTAKEYRTGLIDNGSFSCAINILESDAGQAACLAAFTNSTVNNYKVISASGKTRTFSATCLKFPTVPTYEVDGVQVGDAEWQISGAVTVS